MKFCYVDESGTGSEPFAVMTGIIVDAKRMHITKADWQALLETLSKICNREVSEFHARKFYSGNSPWRDIDGEMRSNIITAIFNWLRDRKHKVTFSGVDKESFNSEIASNAELRPFRSIWCFMAMHLILTIQKHYQKEEKNKGNTVFIFDEELTEKTNLSQLLKNPPGFIDEYYSRRDNQEELDQVIDVPYFGDSENVSLLQIADLVAFIIRRYLELKENRVQPRYSDEIEKISTWVKRIAVISLPVSTRYLSTRRDRCSEIFCRLVPESLLLIGR